MRKKTAQYVSFEVTKSALITTESALSHGGLVIESAPLHVGLSAPDSLMVQVIQTHAF